LCRIVVTQLDDFEDGEEMNGGEEDEDFSKEADVARAIAPHLHSHTFGITSDPLAQFTLVLAVLIHEVNHCGVSNSDINRNSPTDAARYKNRSVIEQQSVDKAWKKLMEPAFADLRKCVYSDDEELKRFRQILVNAVLATGIVDTELQNLRTRWWRRVTDSRP
jgi:hypothetical protein